MHLSIRGRDFGRSFEGEKFLGQIFIFDRFVENLGDVQLGKLLGSSSHIHSFLLRLFDLL